MRTINISCRNTPTDRQQQIGSNWFRQFPKGEPVWGDWRFVFNAVDTDYDYLVVFHKLRVPLKPRCAPENTIYVVAEPPSVRRCEYTFLAQFGAVITQDSRVQHPRLVFSHSGLPWLLGTSVATADNDRRMLGFNDLQQLFAKPKTRLLSVISSDKTNTTGHLKRQLFVHKIKQYFGEQIDLFGHGILTMTDKLDALQDYRFHIVLENSSFNHYFSEKPIDCIIAGSYPVYYGCPNFGDYFPDNSFAGIDINNTATAIATIKRVITENYDIKYRRQLRQARDMAMYEHNFYPMLIKIITGLEQGRYGTAAPQLHDGYILPHSHKNIRRIPVLIRNNVHKLNIFRVLYLAIMGLYLRYSCSKLASRQENTP